MISSMQITQSINRNFIDESSSSIGLALSKSNIVWCFLMHFVLIIYCHILNCVLMYSGRQIFSFPSWQCIYVYLQVFTSFFFCVNLQAVLLLPLGNRSAQLEEPGIIYIWYYIVKFVPRGDLLCFKCLQFFLSNVHYIVLFLPTL